MPGSWAVTAAIAGCAEVGPALDHLAGNFTARVAWVVAAIHYRPARVLRDAAGLLNLRRMLRGVPVGRPLPDVADHVGEAVTVRREGADRRCPLVGAGG